MCNRAGPARTNPRRIRTAAHELLVFHLRVGARVGLRLLASVLAGLFALLSFSGRNFSSCSATKSCPRRAPLPRSSCPSALQPREPYGVPHHSRNVRLDPPSAGRSSRHRRLAAPAVFVSLLPLVAVLSGLAFLRRKDGPYEALTGAIGGPLPACLSVLVLPSAVPGGATARPGAAVLAGTEISACGRRARRGRGRRRRFRTVPGPRAVAGRGPSPLIALAFTVLQQVGPSAPVWPCPTFRPPHPGHVRADADEQSPCRRAAAAAARFTAESPRSRVLRRGGRDIHPGLPPGLGPIPARFSSLRRPAADVSSWAPCPARRWPRPPGPAFRGGDAAALLYLSSGGRRPRPRADSPAQPDPPSSWRAS